MLGGARIFPQHPRMAWRIDEQVTHGEIDNRRKCYLTGRIWFTGREEPVELELTGNPWADLAGHTLRFRNPNPKPGLTDFMNRLGAMMAEADEDFDDDEPQSEAEAKAEAETEWMNRLLDRVTARIEREGREELDFDRIYNEERERLRRECGIPPDPEPTPEEEAQSQEWIAEILGEVQAFIKELPDVLKDSDGES